MDITNTILVVTNVVDVATLMNNSTNTGWPLAFTIIGMMFGFAFIIKWS